jgi:hypothetical protein
MLRVLYKIGSPAENKRLADSGLKVPKLESGAQKARPQPPAEALKRSRKLAEDKVTAKREADAQAEALRDRIWADEQAKLFKDIGYDKNTQGNDVDEALADVLKIEEDRVADKKAEDAWGADHMKRVEAFTGYKSDKSRDEVSEALNELQDIEKSRVAEDAAVDQWSADHMKRVEGFTGYKSDKSRDEVADALAELQTIEKSRVAEEAEVDAWSADHMKRVEAFTGYKSDASRDEVAEALADVQQIEKDRVKSLDERVKRGEVIMGDEMAELMKGVDKAKPARKSEAYKPLLDEIPVNLPASERAHQLEIMRQDLKTKTENAWRTFSALQEQHAKASGHEARALEVRIIAMRGQLDGMVEQEFFADHANPRQAEIFYKKDLAERKRALLTNPEARRVFEKLNEARPDGGWGRGHYITQEMINDLDANERDLGRAWHALEHDQLQLHSGTEVIKNERQAKADVSKLQVDFIRNGKDFGIPANIVESFNLANVNRGDLEKAADQILADLGKYDVPQTARERFLSVGIAAAKGLGFESFFGRKRANAKVNELQLMTDSYKDLSAARAGKRGPQLVLGNASPNFMVATNFGSAFARGAEGSGVILSDRPGESEPALSLEQAEDLQGILTESRHMATALGRNLDSKAVRSSASELAAELQNRLLNYVDTPAARSKVYELANASLQNLERALSDQHDFEEDVEELSTKQPEAKTTKEADVKWEPLEADLGVDWDEAEQMEDLSDLAIEDVDTALEKNADRLSAAQLEKIDRATEALTSSQKGLSEALAQGEPLGKMFIGSLETFVSDREHTLRLLELNRLDKNPAAQDLAQAIRETKVLLKEYSSLEANPKGYKAVAAGLKNAKILKTELDRPASLFDSREVKQRLDQIDRALSEPMPASSAYKTLEQAYINLKAGYDALDWADADLPAVGMSNERNKQFDEAITALDSITTEMKSANLRAKSKDEALITKQGSAYRRALITTGRMLGKTPASMQSTARFQEAQAALKGAETAYELWARKHGQRQVIDSKM